MRNIYDLANELERGIRALPEYKNLVEKKEAIATDAEASALFKEFTDSKRISMLRCRLVQCQQQKNKQLFKNWVKR